MTKLPDRCVMVLGTLALLSACGDEAAAPEPVAETAAVTGEVLEGSISDAMLPLDELQSRAPQAVIVPESDSGGSGGTPATTDGEQAGTAPAEDEPEPDAPSASAPERASATPAAE